MSNYEEKIERGLKLWFKEVQDLTVSSAWIGESEVERGYDGGCDTCGWGADEDTIETPIYYKLTEDDYIRSRTIEGTSLNFLPQLLGYIDRAN